MKKTGYKTTHIVNMVKYRVWEVSKELQVLCVQYYR